MTKGWYSIPPNKTNVSIPIGDEVDSYIYIKRCVAIRIHVRALSTSAVPGWQLAAPRGLFGTSVYMAQSFMAAGMQLHVRVNFNLALLHTHVGAEPVASLCTK